MTPLVLGIDIGGTRIKAGLVAPDGSVVRSTAAPSPGDLAEFRVCLRSLLTGFDARQAAAGCKGIVHPVTTRIEVLPGTMRYLEGQSLADLVREALPCVERVEADNDARVALAGEIAWGAARGRSDVVMLTLGTGVGGGVLSGGRILRGAAGVAGHLGHLTVEPDGALCICGNRGCLETVFSSKTIEAKAFELIHRGCDSALTEQFRGRPSAVTCEDVFDAAAKGDSAARRIVGQAVEKLGAALAGLVLVFDPEIIILGGQIASAGEALFAPVQKEVSERSFGMLRREVPVVRQQAEGGSGVAGAAALIYGQR